VDKPASTEFFLDSEDEFSGEASLHRTNRGCRPFVALHVVDRNKCWLTAHRQANVASLQPLVDLMPKRFNALPLLVGVS
jgi:hypothetical protein